MSETQYIDVNSLAELAAHGIDDVVVAIGVFDGVHKGHQLLLEHLLELSQITGAEPVVMTFFPHPRQVLRPDAPPPVLVPQDEKVKQLHRFGVKAVVTVPFTAKFADMPPQAFLDDCLGSDLVNLRGICVGKEWRFGQGGKGNTDLLKHYSDQGHFAFDAVDELQLEEMTISSTAIRRAITNGDLNLAEKMLGRSYSLHGKVVCGRRVAGSKLSHPTANLIIDVGIVPPNGVYGGYAVYDGKRHLAAIAIGISPTFQHEYEHERRVEVHLLDFNADIYDKQIEVIPALYLREERTFQNAELLKTQIIEDVKRIKIELAE